MKLFRTATLFLILCWTVPTFAAIYQWEDEQGTVNFAEDLGTVPAKYRKKARKVDNEPAQETPESVTGKQPEKPEVVPAPPVPKAETMPAGPDRKKVYGTKDGESWKKEFTLIRDELNTVDGQIESKREMLTHPEGLSRLEYKSLAYEIKNLEQTHNNLLEKLKQLRLEAERSGVPSEFQ